VRGNFDPKPDGKNFRLDEVFNNSRLKRFRGSTFKKKVQRFSGSAFRGLRFRGFIKGRKP